MIISAPNSPARQQGVSVSVEEVSREKSLSPVSSAAPRTLMCSGNSKDYDERKRLLNSGFCPEGIRYLYDVLGLDLWSEVITLDVIRNIADGRMTQPVDIVVRPVCWDRIGRMNVEGEALKVTCSLVVRLPYDAKTFKPVPPSAEHRVFISTYPCRRYLLRGEPDANRQPVIATPRGSGSISFTEGERFALENLGIRSDRLYSGSFNSFSYEERQSMVSGRTFDMNGVVRVVDPFGVRQHIALAGEARLVSMPDGSLRPEFLSYRPGVCGPGEIVDIVGASRMDRLELDIFERDEKQRVRTDAYGNPVLNAAGRNLVEFGHAFGPVGGWVHSEKWDAVKRRFERQREYACYCVSVVNGGLCATRMREVKEKNPDGSVVMEQRWDAARGQQVECERSHWEVPEAKVSDGKVRVGNQNLRPVSAEDLENFRRGIGGFFRGYMERPGGVNARTAAGTLMPRIRRDVFAVPDNANNGFARPFSAEEGERIRARLGEKSRVKKQNFKL